MRLDGHPGGSPQMTEPERGHEPDDRRRGRLMAADLEPAGIGPDPVGVVDDRGGQPEHLALDLAQGAEVRGFGPQLSHGCMRARARWPAQLGAADSYSEIQ